MPTRITRDGKTIEVVPDENAAVAWVHRNLAYSVHHALTHEGYAFVEARTCFFIPPDAYVEGKGFIPSIVTEDEPGHAPLVGSGDFAQPWYWGATYDEAKAHAEAENAKLGLTPKDVSSIIISSMRASNINEQINLAMCGPAGEHEHIYEPTFRLSHLAGTPHRRCTIEGCRFIALDSDECDCADFAHCSSCHAWAEKVLESGFSPWSGEYIKPGDVIETLPPKWY